MDNEGDNGWVPDTPEASTISGEIQTGQEENALNETGSHQDDTDYVHGDADSVQADFVDEDTNSADHADSERYSFNTPTHQIGERRQNVQQCNQEAVENIDKLDNDVGNHHVTNMTRDRRNEPIE